MFNSPSDLNNKCFVDKKKREFINYCAVDSNKNILNQNARHFVFFLEKFYILLSFCYLCMNFNKFYWQ